MMATTAVALAVAAGGVAHALPPGPPVRSAPTVVTEAEPPPLDIAGPLAAAAPSGAAAPVGALDPAAGRASDAVEVVVLADPPVPESRAPAPQVRAPAPRTVDPFSMFPAATIPSDVPGPAAAPIETVLPVTTEPAAADAALALPEAPVQPVDLHLAGPGVAAATSSDVLPTTR